MGAGAGWRTRRGNRDWPPDVDGLAADHRPRAPVWSRVTCPAMHPNAVSWRTPCPETAAGPYLEVVCGRQVGHQRALLGHHARGTRARGRGGIYLVADLWIQNGYEGTARAREGTLSAAAWGLGLVRVRVARRGRCGLGGRQLDASDCPCTRLEAQGSCGSKLFIHRRLCKGCVAAPQPLTLTPSSVATSVILRPNSSSPMQPMYVVACFTCGSQESHGEVV
jgi:hypothetical protein